LLLALNAVKINKFFPCPGEVTVTPRYLAIEIGVVPFSATTSMVLVNIHTTTGELVTSPSFVAL